jgi:hypothetical protein
MHFPSVFTYLQGNCFRDAGWLISPWIFKLKRRIAMSPDNSARMVKYVAWGFLGFAFIWGLAPYSAVNEPARLLLDMLNWPLGDAAPVLTRSEMWLSSIGAGLTVAISIMLLGIVVPALRQSNKETIRVTIWTFIGWYLVDGIGSYASGVGSNVFFNTIFFAVIMIPLLAVRYEK